MRRKKMPLSVKLVKSLMYLMFILATSMILTAVVCSSASDILGLTRESESVTVSIPENASLSDVSKAVSNSGIIKKRGLFKFFMQIMHVKKGDIREGEYVIDASSDYRAIVNSLKKNSSQKETVRITIPEGYTTEQIVELLVKNKVCSESELWDAIKNHDFNYTFLAGLKNDERRLEGYLFPDTYDFYIGDSGVNAISRFLKNFNSKFTQEMSDKAEELGYSVNEILTIASLVEREAKLADEQKRISGVIHNRLNSKSYPYLQIDASIQYVLGHKQTLTLDDLKIDSPYNTYTNKGLPPGPIANPGLGAISAALNPEDHSYYFYVAKSDGSHIFSHTLAEHNAAKQSVQ